MSLSALLVPINNIISQFVDTSVPFYLSEFDAGLTLHVTQETVSAASGYQAAWNVVLCVARGFT